MVAAPLPPTTHSAGSVDLGTVVATNFATGALPGLGFCRAGRSGPSGATDAPITASSPLCAQISSLHTGGFGAEPPTPTAPINCLFTTMGSPPELSNKPR